MQLNNSDDHNLWHNIILYIWDSRPILYCCILQKNRTIHLLFKKCGRNEY